MTSLSVVVVEPKVEPFIATNVTQYSKRCEGVTTLPAPGAKRVMLSVYPAHIVIKGIVQGKHSSDHTYSSLVESKQVAG